MPRPETGMKTEKLMGTAEILRIRVIRVEGREKEYQGSLRARARELC